MGEGGETCISSTSLKVCEMFVELLESQHYGFCVPLFNCSQSTGVSWTAMLQKPEMEGDRCGHFLAIPGMWVSALAVGSRGLSPHSFLQETISGSNRVAFPRCLLMLSCVQVVQRVQDVSLTMARLCCAFMEAREPVMEERGWHLGSLDALRLRGSDAHVLQMGQVTLCAACPESPDPSYNSSGWKSFFFFFLIFPQPDAVNPTKTSDWGRDYVLRFQPLSVSGVNFRPALE